MQKLLAERLFTQLGLAYINLKNINPNNEQGCQLKVYKPQKKETRSKHCSKRVSV